MTTPTTYDAIVVGAGQGGVPLAKALAGAGRRTALVEREHVGGTCINVGCTPTKTMVASAREAYAARRGGEFGVSAGQVSVDMPRVRQRKRDMVESWRTSDERRLAATEGLDLLMGETRFTGSHDLEVSLRDGGSRSLRAELIVLDVGGRPGVPELPGLPSIPHLDSTSIMELDVVPRRLLILGGGYVAVEFAQMFRRFGSEVAVVQRGEHLLSREDADVAQGLTDILTDEGVEVRTRAKARSVRLLPGDASTAGTAQVELSIEADGIERCIRGSHLLIATGRVPNSDSLDLDTAGIETDERGHVRVDSRLRTNVDGVYAIGDVKGGPAFTHVSYDDFRILRTNLLEGGDASTEGRLVPYAVFTDPELGRVGMTEDQARAAGRRVRVAKLAMDQVSRALETGESRGFMKAVVDEETDLILGAAILSFEGGESMATLEVAMMGGVTASTLREAVFTHPTFAEAFNTLFKSWV